MAKYVKNSYFYSLLKDYQENRTRSSYEKIGRIILDIAYGLSEKWNFKNYSEDIKNDMLSLGIQYATKAIDKYSLEMKNPHSFFTETIKNGFIQILNKYRQWENIIFKFDLIENCSDFNDDVY